MYIILYILWGINFIITHIKTKKSSHVEQKPVTFSIIYAIITTNQTAIKGNRQFM